MQIDIKRLEKTIKEEIESARGDYLFEQTETQRLATAVKDIATLSREKLLPFYKRAKREVEKARRAAQAGSQEARERFDQMNRQFLQAMMDLADQDQNLFDQIIARDDELSRGELAYLIATQYIGDRKSAISAVFTDDPDTTSIMDMALQLSELDNIPIIRDAMRAVADAGVVAYPTFKQNFRAALLQEGASDYSLETREKIKQNRRENPRNTIATLRFLTFIFSPGGRNLTLDKIKNRISKRNEIAGDALDKLSRRLFDLNSQLNGRIGRFTMNKRQIWAKANEARQGLASFVNRSIGRKKTNQTRQFIKNANKKGNLPDGAKLNPKEKKIIEDLFDEQLKNGETLDQDRKKAFRKFDIKAEKVIVVPEHKTYKVVDPIIARAGGNIIIDDTGYLETKIPERRIAIISISTKDGKLIEKLAIDINNPAVVGGEYYAGHGLDLNLGNLQNSAKALEDVAQGGTGTEEFKKRLQNQVSERIKSASNKGYGKELAAILRDFVGDGLTNVEQIELNLNNTFKNKAFEKFFDAKDFDIDSQNFSADDVKKANSASTAYKGLLNFELADNGALKFEDWVDSNSHRPVGIEYDPFGFFSEQNIKDKAQKTKVQETKKTVGELIEKITSMAPSDRARFLMLSVENDPVYITELAKRIREENIVLSADARNFLARLQLSIDDKLSPWPSAGILEDSGVNILKAQIAAEAANLSQTLKRVVDLEANITKITGAKAYKDALSAAKSLKNSKGIFQGIQRAAVGTGKIIADDKALAAISPIFVGIKKTIGILAPGDQKIIEALVFSRFIREVLEEATATDKPNVIAIRELTEALRKHIKEIQEAIEDGKFGKFLDAEGKPIQNLNVIKQEAEQIIKRLARSDSAEAAIAILADIENKNSSTNKRILAAVGRGSAKTAIFLLKAGFLTSIPFLTSWQYQYYIEEGYAPDAAFLMTFFGLFDPTLVVLTLSVEAFLVEKKPGTLKCAIAKQTNVAEPRCYGLKSYKIKKTATTPERDEMPSGVAGDLQEQYLLEQQQEYEWSSAVEELIYDQIKKDFNTNRKIYDRYWQEFNYQNFKNIPNVDNWQRRRDGGTLATLEGTESAIPTEKDGDQYRIFIDNLSNFIGQRGDDVRDTAAGPTIPKAGSDVIAAPKGERRETANKLNRHLDSLMKETPAALEKAVIDRIEELGDKIKTPEISKQPLNNLKYQFGAAKSDAGGNVLSMRRVIEELYFRSNNERLLQKVRELKKSLTEFNRTLPEMKKQVLDAVRVSSKDEQGAKNVVSPVQKVAQEVADFQAEFKDLIELLKVDENFKLFLLTGGQELIKKSAERFKTEADKIDDQQKTPVNANSKIYQPLMSLLDVQDLYGKLLFRAFQGNAYPRATDEGSGEARTSYNNIQKALKAIDKNLDINDFRVQGKLPYNFKNHFKIEIDYEKQMEKEVQKAVDKDYASDSFYKSVIGYASKLFGF